MPPATERRRKRRLKSWLKAASLVVLIWLLAAYLILPLAWRHFEHHRVLELAPKTSVTAQGIPGDPLNLAVIGSEEGLVQAMLRAGWDPADPVTMKSSLHIAGSVLLRRPYLDAPVSSLFVFGRKQDLAFEKPAGRSASRRHHVRFWRSAELGKGDLPLWLGAATYDRSVGFSHRTAQVTHHIGPDIDAERNHVIIDLIKTGAVARLFQVTGVGPTLLGRNGGGDRYFTDGELTVAVLAHADAPGRLPERLDNPAVVQIKDQLWSAIAPMLQSLNAP
jgi:hypothetical protein